MKDYLWIGAAEGLVRYNLNSPINTKSGFTTLIRNVSTTAGENLFLGAVDAKMNSTAIDFSKNGIIIQYSAPYFEDDNPLENSYRLVGFNDEWSDWTTILPWSMETYSKETIRLK